MRTNSRTKFTRFATLVLVTAAALTCLPARGIAWEGEPAPPYPPRPSASSPPRRIPPQRYAYPYAPPPVVAPPPPLSPVTRALYAPFYVAGLVVRYGFYYAVVAPIEVFSRTVTYGERGGVERRSDRAPEEG
jgi:hypothetical protein